MHWQAKLGFVMVVWAILYSLMPTVMLLILLFVSFLTIMFFPYCVTMYYIDKRANRWNQS